MSPRRLSERSQEPGGERVIHSLDTPKGPPLISVTPKKMASRMRSLLSGYSVESDRDHANVSDRISSDRYLNAVYAFLYRRLLESVPSYPKGRILEIGSGAGYIETIDPRVIRLDIDPTACVNVCADAIRLPFRDGAFDGIVMKDALHHIPDPEALFLELIRILTPSGTIAMIDPYWGPLARLVYKYLHPEPFDDRATTWEFESTGPDSSNQALLNILLRRDRRRFDELFPHLRIDEVGPVLGPSFLFSGGVHGRTPIPGSLLERLFHWENRRSARFDPLRFEYLVLFTKTSEQ